MKLAAKAENKDSKESHQFLRECANSSNRPVSSLLEAIYSWLRLWMFGCTTVPLLEANSGFSGSNASHNYCLGLGCLGGLFSFFHTISPMPQCWMATSLAQHHQFFAHMSQRTFSAPLSLKDLKWRLLSDVHEMPFCSLHFFINHDWATCLSSHKTPFPVHRFLGFQANVFSEALKCKPQHGTHEGHVLSCCHCLPWAFHANNRNGFSNTRM